jgi:ABC-type amino acid transport substrate-binding protein
VDLPAALPGSTLWGLLHALIPAPGVGARCRYPTHHLQEDLDAQDDGREQPATVLHVHRRVGGVIPMTAVPWTFVPVLAAFLAAGCAGGDVRDAEGMERGGERPDLVPAAESRDRGDAFHEVTSRGRGTVTVLFTPSRGFAFRNDAGEPTGVTVEIVRDFFRWVEAREGVELDIRWLEEDEWGRFYRRVRDGSGGVLGLGNVTITDERREEVDFSPPYLDNVAVLITRQEVPELPSMDEAPSHFAGFTAYPRRGTLHEDRVEGLRDRSIPGFQVRYLSSMDAIIAAVQEGPDRLAWVDIHNFWREAERGAPIRRHPAGDDSSEVLAIILPRGSDWTPVLEAFFHEGEGYRNSPRYQELLETHLGEGLANLLQDVRQRAAEDR